MCTNNPKQWLANVRRSNKYTPSLPLPAPCPPDCGIMGPGETFWCKGFFPSMAQVDWCNGISQGDQDIFDKCMCKPYPFNMSCQPGLNINRWFPSTSTYGQEKVGFW